jgi:hypothetical protein
MKHHSHHFRKVFHYPKVVNLDDYRRKPKQKSAMYNIAKLVLFLLAIVFVGPGLVIKQ